MLPSHKSIELDPTVEVVGEAQFGVTLNNCKSDNSRTYVRDDTLGGPGAMNETSA